MESQKEAANLETNINNPIRRLHTRITVPARCDVVNPHTRVTTTTILSTTFWVRTMAAAVKQGGGTTSITTINQKCGESNLRHCAEQQSGCFNACIVRYTGGYPLQVKVHATDCESSPYSCSGQGNPARCSVGTRQICCCAHERLHRVMRHFPIVYFLAPL